MPTRALHRCFAVLAFAAAASVTAMAQTASPADAATTIVRLRSLADACSSSAAACKPDDVGSNLTVGNPRSGGYVLDFGWLRDALHTANTASPEARTSSMRAAAAHLDGLLIPAANTNASTYTRAQSAVSSVLARDEFSADDTPTWWERQRARFWNWLYLLYNGIDNLGSSNPWLGRLLEWLLFLGAATGLGLLLVRSIRQQRLQVALGKSSAQVKDLPTLASKAWAERAEASAAAGDFREAVHCLYWAGVVRLEEERIVRRDPSRTPREYVRLLQPGSATRGALATLTALLERTWYGLREASAADYANARAALGSLQGRKPEATQ